MDLRPLIQELNAETLILGHPRVLDRDYTCVFAADLMSDALAMVNSDCKKTLLVTGLQNAQSLRTAEMLDIDTIIYVRGKHPVQEDLKMAAEMEINVFCTSKTMYETCGILFKLGLVSAVNDD
ncbi:MAG: hypothetical protein A2Y20_05710 [Firmicutes bacterium GWF2_51_9]|nr:hypothetical protein [Erysipelotrichaceae bacterium]OGS54799.1 MAG: hypothetical protein A2Y20_05710 [Firmicutes bacterium GWF2_51_9]OGS58867.1 MAG: hypothetical protein A2Y19_06445 [Firmicutes bacterium GWE2_51_13]HAM63535.1 hypothetical protein [Erysipelotrichaceae bacterium]HBZ41014.1 hypothetical protein [Erysipelotrichaceae bacterium]